MGCDARCPAQARDPDRRGGARLLQPGSDGRRGLLGGPPDPGRDPVQEPGAGRQRTGQARGWVRWGALLPMTADLIVRPSLPQLAADAVGFGKQTVCEATRKRWAVDWAKFQAWCAEYGQQSLPAEPSIVAIYLSALANGNVPTVWIDVHKIRRETQRPLK